MKTLFIEAKSNAEISLPEQHMAKLPKKIALATTAQHAHKIKCLKAQLERAGKKVALIKGRHSKHEGQILGCDVPKGVKAESVLFVGTGSFHPEAFSDGKVFVYNPISKRFYVDKRPKRNKKAALARFYASDSIGVLISIKPGQTILERALRLKKRYKQKSFYCLVSDTVILCELENFPFIQCFVNAACPRISDDADRSGKTVLNINDLL